MLQILQVAQSVLENFSSSGRAAFLWACGDQGGHAGNRHGGTTAASGTSTGWVTRFSNRFTDHRLFRLQGWVLQTPKLRFTQSVMTT